MKTFYFDYKILGNERIGDEEYKLRLNLQRSVSAAEALKELGSRRGLYGIAARKEEARRG